MKGQWSKCFLPILIILAVGCVSQSVSQEADQAIAIDIPEKKEIDLYRIQVKDVVEIKFFSNPEYNDKVMVRPDGKISLILIDDLQAFGLTPMELDQLITEKYSKTLLQPEVTVIVREIGAKVFVGGEVRRPGIFPYDRPLTALQAIFVAGGFINSSEPSSVILIRKNVNNKLIAMKIDLRKALEKEPESDIFLRPTDILFVPKSNIAKVNLFMEQYVRSFFPLQIGYTGIADWFFGMGFNNP